MHNYVDSDFFESLLVFSLQLSKEIVAMAAVVDERASARFTNP